ncbi:MAG: hypothetical protein PUC39_08510 [Lachnospiraceae bacterium]|nr:hypothetical protein [Lachnospiraceae bacterium]
MTRLFEDLYDADKILEEREEESRERGREETLFNLVKSNYITKEIAVSQLNVSEEEFDERYNKWLLNK